MTLIAGGDITNRSGIIDAGGRVTIASLGGDIINETLIRETLGDRPGVVRDSLQERASITAGDDLTLSAGRDIISSGATIAAGGDAVISAARDLVLQTTSLRDQLTMSGKNWTYS
ncbi:hemagglutinin repeat-containing protein, partial [Rhodospirillum sp. A1_3_36]|uniref:hemagglutinin repeat-containing protein n=1 Tax=Rhodospirillum sp. A1_3_36 TaxID=3391666 RepID=UPI0039A4F9F9